MKAGWQTRKLGEVCSLLNRGISPRYLKTGGICVLNQRCIRDHQVSYDPARRHDARAKHVDQARLVQPGDVLVNSTGTGTLGRVAQVREAPSEPTTVDSHVTIVRAKPGTVHPDFFGYMLMAIEDSIKEAGEGCGGQTELSRSVLAERFVVHYPDSQAVQRRIVSTLDGAFESIAAAEAATERNRRNAHALFDSHLEAAFAQRDKEWVGTTLEHVLAVQPQNGWSPPAACHSDSGVPVLTLSAVTGFRFRPEKIKFTSAPTDPRRHYWVRDGDLLITRSNTPELVGHVAIASGINEPTIYPDLIMRMNPFPERMTTKFLYYQLRTSALRRAITARAQGANPTMKKISNSGVRTLSIAAPSVATQRAIVGALDRLAQDTQRLAALYERKLIALGALKKSLLHHAFSGQL